MLLAHPAPVLTLPPAFEAFYALQYTPYLVYAQHHLPPEQAISIVKKTFGTLATRWSQLVSSTNPTAEAWEHHSHEVRHHALSSPPAATDCPLRYDLLALAALGYAPAQSADITGHHLSKICYLTRAAGPLTREPGRLLDGRIMTERDGQGSSRLSHAWEGELLRPADEGSPM